MKGRERKGGVIDTKMNDKESEEIEEEIELKL